MFSLASRGTIRRLQVSHPLPMDAFIGVALESFLSFESEQRSGLSAAFGVLYVMFVFIYFRKSMSMGDAEAFFLTAFCALNPIVLFCSVTSSQTWHLRHFPRALVVADSATKPNGNRWLL